MVLSWSPGPTAGAHGRSHSRGHSRSFSRSMGFGQNVMLDHGEGRYSPFTACFLYQLELEEQTHREMLGRIQTNIDHYQFKHNNPARPQPLQMMIADKMLTELILGSDNSANSMARSASASSLKSRSMSSADGAGVVAGGSGAGDVGDTTTGADGDGSGTEGGGVAWFQRTIQRVKRSFTSVGRKSSATPQQP